MNQLKYHEIIDQITIGRITGEITCPEDGRMSGKHAQVTLEKVEDENVAYIQDLASKNRTILGRVEIVPNQKIPIKIFCLIEVGDQQLVLTDNTSVNLADINEIVELSNLKICKLFFSSFRHLEPTTLTNSDLSYSSR